MSPDGHLVVRTAREVEGRLVQHYLHTESSSGAGPLKYIDASAAELQEALGTSDSPRAVRSLLDACGEVETADFLARGWSGTWPDAAAPGFFRFLVLTCAVVASADENPESQDFGLNLQRLFHTNRTFGPRAGLPVMWNALSKWCNRKHAAGAPVRRVELPAPGAGIHIGLTNAISFPNWRDVHRIRAEFERNPALAKRTQTPSDVARVLCPRISSHAGYSDRIVSASDEFHRLYMSRASLLYVHRLWGVVCRALERARPRAASNEFAVRVELQFGASAEDTTLRFAALGRDGTERQRDPIPLEAILEHAVEQFRVWGGDHPSVQLWRNLFAAGAVPFVQERFGVWSATEMQPASEGSWLYLVKRARIAKLRHLAAARCSSLTPEWTLVGPMIAKDALLISRALGLDDGSQNGIVPIPFALAYGVRTQRGWLGRTTVLPWLQREGRGELSMQPSDPNKAGPKLVEIDSGRLQIVTATPLDGDYRVRLEERAKDADSLAVEKTVRFTADAPEHPALRAFSDRWRMESECCDAAWTQGEVESESACESERSIDASHSRFDDFLEVVYALGRSQWSERSLVEAIRHFLPGPSPWDVMRSLQEAGWLARATYVTWKASSWCLVEPYLVPITLGGQPAAVLAGSSPMIIRRRLIQTTEAHGGTVRSHLGVGWMSPPTVVVSCVDVDRLGQELGWKVQLPRLSSRLAAPGCWPNMAKDTGQHRLVKEWDWRTGRFADSPTHETSERFALGWWHREEGDRPDLFAVEGREGSRFVTASRVVALAEAYRAAARPMFKVNGGRLVRLPVEGHLPLHLATLLHLNSLCASGPINSALGWTYEYAVNRQGLDLLRVVLGRRFAFVEGMPEPADRPRSVPSTAFGFSRHRAAATANLIRWSV